MDADSRQIATDWKTEQLDKALEKFMEGAGRFHKPTASGYLL